MGGPNPQEPQFRRLQNSVSLPSRPAPSGPVVARRSYPGSVNSLHRLTPIVCALSFAHAADLKPETTAAFDHYVKLTEEGIDKRTGSDFLLLETNAKQKTLVW